MKKCLFAIVNLLLGWFLVFRTATVVYAGSCGSLSGPGCECAPGTTDVPSLACFAPIVVNIINVAFLFLGFVALVFLLYGSLRFIISRGDPKALQAARNTMTYAIIGMILILFVFVIVNVITNMLRLPNILQNFSFYQP